MDFRIAGRASRSEFWYFTLFQFVIYCLFGIFGSILTDGNGNPPGWFNLIVGLYGLVTFLPVIAVSVRRLHDTGRGGGWFFINFVPVIGSIWFIVLCVLPTEPRPNRFGPIPE